MKACHLKIILLLPVSLLFIVAAAQTKKHIALKDELKTLYDVASLPAYRTNTISAQISTYDTTGGNNDGFNGNYSFIRRKKDSSLVIFDVDGPGVVNRIWTPTPTVDTLDIYIDDTLKPALTICYMDLFSGKVYPFILPLCGNQLGGYYCYVPFLFQKKCIIVSRGKSMQFHQVQYRLYEAGIVVKSFSKQFNEEEKNALQKVGTLWNKSIKAVTDFVEDKTNLRSVQLAVNLKPGETNQLLNINKGGRIIGIELTPAETFEGLYKNADIRIFWDDEKLPAVDCPVADFFGYAFGKPSMQSLLLGTDGQRNYCYFPMPFDRSARIELVYRNAKDTLLPSIPVTAKVYYTSQKRNLQEEGKFYTSWQQSVEKLHQPHTFLEVKGKGQYVGTLLQAQGLRQGMTIFFEGDDSTVIDGNMRLHGTGSEDYFNGGWYALLDRWDSKMSLPLHGSLDYSLIFSRTGGYRFYLSDKLSFEKSFYHTIEHGPEENAAPALYSSLGFYYGNTPVKNIVKPEEVNTNVYIPDTLNIYPQFTNMIIGENIELKTTWDSSIIGQSFDAKVKDESKLRLSLESVPSGMYKVFITYTEQENGCSFSLWQRQTQFSKWIDSKQGGEKVAADKDAGTVTVTRLNNTITLRFKTTEDNNRFKFSKLMLVKSR